MLKVNNTNAKIQNNCELAMKNHNFLIIFALIILNMKYMWMIIFMVLPLLAVVYIGWHVWVMLPFSAVWKSDRVACMGDAPLFSRVEVCFDRPWRMLFPAAVRFGSQEV